MVADLSIKKAALINMTAKYSVVVIQLLYSAILARILTPKDYGIVSVINVFVVFFTILADLGIGSAIIQRHDLRNDDLNNIYSFSFVLGFGLAIVFAFISVPVSYFYGDKVYLKVGPLLATAVFFNTLNTVPNGLLLKGKKFVLVGVRQVIVSIICSVIAIICAKFGFRYYSLLVFSILTAVFNFFWNITGSGLKFKYKWNLNSLIAIRSYSSYIFGFNIINYFSRNLDNLLVGKLMGTTELGNYNKAYQLMLYPMNMLTNVITPVLQPMLAERQNDKEYIYQSFLKTVKILSLLGTFTMVFCFFTCDELIYILYGNQWAKTVPCFRLLSISIWSQMICATSGAMFQILNQTKIQFNRGLLAVVTTVSSILIGLYFGSIVSVSFFVMLAYNSNFITMLIFLVKDSFGKNPFEFLKQLIPDFIIGSVIGVVLYIISLLGIENKLMSFIVKFFVSVFLYIVLMVLTKQIKYFNVFPNRRSRNC